MAQKYHILREYANGLMDEKNRFFPFSVIGATSTQASLLPARKDVRYFIKYISMANEDSGIVATHEDYIGITISKVTQKLASLEMAAMTQATDFTSLCYSGNPGILCDRNTAVSTTLATAKCRFIIVYAEVEEQEGEYSA